MTIGLNKCSFILLLTRTAQFHLNGSPSLLRRPRYHHLHLPLLIHSRPQTPAFCTPSTSASTFPNHAPSITFFSSVVLIPWAGGWELKTEAPLVGDEVFEDLDGDAEEDLDGEEVDAFSFVGEEGDSFVGEDGIGNALLVGDVVDLVNREGGGRDGVRGSWGNGCCVLPRSRSRGGMGESFCGLSKMNERD